MLLIGIFAVSGLNMPQVTYAQSRQEPVLAVDDNSLESRIKAGVESEKSLAGFDISVELDDGVATIAGTVKSDEQRARAQRLAMIPGVKNVRNEIVVDPTATPKSAKVTGTTGTTDRAAAKTKAGAEKGLDATKKGTDVAIDKTKEGLGKAVDATKKVVEKAVGGATVATDAGKNTGQQVGEAFSDGWITTKVKGKIVDDALVKNSSIQVETVDHVVTLKGAVPSADAKARAEELARTTDGVKGVVNELMMTR